jgi:hypothetical protein
VIDRILSRDALAEKLAAQKERRNAPIMYSRSNRV